MSKFMLSSAAATSHNRYLLHIARGDQPKCGHKIVKPVFVDKIIHDEPQLGCCQRCGTEDDFTAVESGIPLPIKEKPMPVRQTWNGLITLSSLMKVYNESRRQHFWTDDMLRRGFGVAMNKSTHRYAGHWRTLGHEKPWQHFDRVACSCKGSIRAVTCKHKVAAYLLDEALQLDAHNQQVSVDQGVQLPLEV